MTLGLVHTHQTLPICCLIWSTPTNRYIRVCMCVYVCVRVCACVCACVLKKEPWISPWDLLVASSLGSQLYYLHPCIWLIQASCVVAVIAPRLLARVAVVAFLTKWCPAFCLPAGLYCCLFVLCPKPLVLELAFACFYPLALLYFALSCSYSILVDSRAGLATVCLSITSTRIVLCNLALVSARVCAH